MTEPGRKALGQLLAAERPLTWVFAGDSVTAGLRHTVGRRDYTELFAERIRSEMGRRLDVVVNTAVGGWTVRHVLDAVDHVALRFRPDVVVIGVGLNDRRAGLSALPEFTSAYHSLLDAIQNAGAVAVLQTPNLCLATAPHPTDTLGHYAHAIRHVAAARNAPVVDHYQIWTDAGLDRVHGWIGNGCHPNGFGHRVMARTLFRTLGIYEESSLTCQLTVP